MELLTGQLPSAQGAESGQVYRSRAGCCPRRTLLCHGLPPPPRLLLGLRAHGILGVAMPGCWGVRSQRSLSGRCHIQLQCGWDSGLAGCPLLLRLPELAKPASLAGKRKSTPAHSCPCTPSVPTFWSRAKWPRLARIGGNLGPQHPLPSEGPQNVLTFLEGDTTLVEGVLYGITGRGEWRTQAVGYSAVCNLVSPRRICRCQCLETRVTLTPEEGAGGTKSEPLWSLCASGCPLEKVGKHP